MRHLLIHRFEFPQTQLHTGHEKRCLERPEASNPLFCFFCILQGSKCRRQTKNVVSVCHVHVRPSGANVAQFQLHRLLYGVLHSLGLHVFAKRLVLSLILDVPKLSQLLADELVDGLIVQEVVTMRAPRLVTADALQGSRAVANRALNRLRLF